MSRQWIPIPLRKFEWYHTFSGLGITYAFLKIQTPGGDVTVRWYNLNLRKITSTWGDGYTEWFETVEQVRDRLVNAGI